MMFNATFSPSLVFWPVFSRQLFVIFLYLISCYHLQKCFWPRGRVLGGSNNLNYLVYIRGSRHDYNQWATEACTGWSYKDVLPYFLKMEDMEIPRYQTSRMYCFIFAIIRIQFSYIRHRTPLPILAILLMSFGFVALKHLYVI